MRKLLLSICFLSLIVPFFGKDLKQSKFNIEANYYGLPINVKAGYLYRYNDFSTFPYLGLEFNSKDYLYLESFAGFSLGYKNLSWDNKFSYELLPSLVDKDFDIFYGQTTPGIAFNYGKIALPIAMGRHNYLSVDGKQVKSDFLSLTLDSTFFLFDEGWTKGGVNTVQSFTNVFKSDFSFFDFRLSVPVTFFTNYTDIALNYSFRYLNELKSNKNNEKLDVRIPYSKITGRIFFEDKAENKYNQIHCFEVETRWYFLRYINSFNSCFLSLFGNVGVGINNGKSCDLLYEYGIGVGYTLVDNVPFTIQVGFNHNNQFVLYTGVVARISHRP